MIGVTVFRSLPIQLISALVVLVSLLLLGAKFNDNEWQKRYAEQKQQYEVALEKSKLINRDTEIKYITKREIIRERGEDQIRYIDREITKYDNTCVLPKELIKVHNEATKAP